MALYTGGESIKWIQLRLTATTGVRAPEVSLMGRKPKNTPEFQQIDTEQGQLYTFGTNQFLVETKVFREHITLGASLEKLMKGEVDEMLPLSSRST